MPPWDEVMPQFNRRALLAGSAAALAGGPALAAAPKAAAQGPGVYRHKLGDIQLTALYDGLWSLKIDDTFVRNASGSEVDKALGAAFLAPGILQFRSRCCWSTPARSSC
jgi:hypothetical protein